MDFGVLSAFERTTYGIDMEGGTENKDKEMKENLYIPTCQDSSSF